MTCCVRVAVRSGRVADVWRDHRLRLILATDFVDEFGAGARFTWLFAICAGAMGVAAFANSRLVERLGTRMISQSALLALIALALVHLLVVEAGLETLTSFTILQALILTCIGLCGSNFVDGDGAGWAYRRNGFVGAGLHRRSAGGFGDRPVLCGTTLPLAVGYLCIGLSVLAIVYVIEGGRLFHAREAASQS